MLTEGGMQSLQCKKCGSRNVKKNGLTATGRQKYGSLGISVVGIMIKRKQIPICDVCISHCAQFGGEHMFTTEIPKEP
jgi:hypothetical protein